MPRGFPRYAVALAVVCCLASLLSTPALVLAQPQAQNHPAGPAEGATLPAGPLQAPWRVYHGFGQVRHLSFSPDAVYLAVSTAADEVSVLDLTQTTDDGPVWSWSYPETLKTSLGEILWPWSPMARETWSKGNWAL
ncbi:MAG: hypothetical protein HPY69_15135 [Armatimonadetes bacterium]|nr:hypothetical protein [Armatimonadota bacterium]